MGYWEISTRVSLRWIPDPPSEPTDTLVFNVGSFFVDLRVLKADGSIDWAMAGERQVVSQDPLKCRWVHIVDSKGHSAESHPDEGTFSKLPNGDDLERGKMPCPEKGGAITEYEEIWRVIEPLPGLKWAWILQSDDGKTFLGRVGGGYIALREGGEGSFGARREEWDADEGVWKVKYAVGERTVLEDLPSFSAIGKENFEGESGWKVGEQVEIFEKHYFVRAFESL